MKLLPDLLADRVRSDASAPLVTHYASPTERTELSARTFANWVDKTANLIVEDDLSPGDRVRLAVADQHPAHWMTLVWTLAAWQAGLTVTDGAADLVVTGPEADGGPGSYACSLHPLGAGLRDLPEGVRDYSTEALAQPDTWWAPEPPEASWPAWDVAGRGLDAAAVVGSAEPRADRAVVVDAGDPWQAVQRALVAPLAGGGSTVVVAATLSRAERSRVAETEL